MTSIVSVLKKYPKLRIGTRESKLALAQTKIFCDKLKEMFQEIPRHWFEIVPIKTTGDQIQDVNLYEIGGKDLFVKEIEKALLDREIDIAVHSMKDVGSNVSDELTFPCILTREDPRDAFLSLKYKNIDNLPLGATVGTSSPRRKAILLNLRPDLNIVPFRGNVNTRIDKLNQGLVDATLLAVAGLRRLGIAESSYRILKVHNFLPAAGQGAVGIQCRKEDTAIIKVLHEIDDPITHKEVEAERSFLKVLQADCKTPLAAHAVIEDEKLFLQCLYLTLDGKTTFKVWKVGNPSDAHLIGMDAGKEMLKCLP